jgi:hypothetical protein
MRPRSALIRLIVVNAATGAALGLGLGLGVLGANSAAMAHLIAADQAAATALALLLTSFGALGAAAVTASAIMDLGNAARPRGRSPGTPVMVRSVRRSGR